METGRYLREAAISKGHKISSGRFVIEKSTGHILKNSSEIASGSRPGRFFSLIEDLFTLLNDDTNN